MSDRKELIGVEEKQDPKLRNRRAQKEDNVARRGLAFELNVHIPPYHHGLVDNLHRCHDCRVCLGFGPAGVVAGLFPFLRAWVSRLSHIFF
ncbi:hypothetical protein BDV23DRAFT_148767 [Aspergillus alliaceus]|uniref:Uncharacterized protein n=1 Tax=Petromyces alliaceus TaxID=209559 RepID=A0A5N7CI90_PETAA|nr:hypothetical protein BDV23DRAFT_148767 [Aspergillus alliaceus]